MPVKHARTYSALSEQHVAVLDDNTFKFLEEAESRAHLFLALEFFDELSVAEFAARLGTFTELTTVLLAELNLVNIGVETFSAGSHLGEG